MAGKLYFNAMDRSQEWYADLLANHIDEAKSLLQKVLESADYDANGCLVTPTKSPRKVRLLGGQDRAYRFVYCLTHQTTLTREQVVRHRCSNRRCINPDHLEVGYKADNLQDERDRQAYGIDFKML